MTDPRRRIALRLGGLAALALVLPSCARKADGFLATDITGIEWGRDFRLTDAAGKPRALADFRGKAVMLFFGYTHCPDASGFYAVDHLSAIFAFDPQGRLRLYIKGETEPQAIAHDLRLLLQS